MVNTNIQDKDLDQEDEKEVKKHNLTNNSMEEGSKVSTDPMEGETEAEISTDTEVKVMTDMMEEKEVVKEEILELMKK